MVILLRTIFMQVQQFWEERAAQCSKFLGGKFHLMLAWVVGLPLCYDLKGRQYNGFLFSFSSFLVALLSCCEKSWIYGQVNDGRCVFRTLWGPFLVLLPSREDYEEVAWSSYCVWFQKGQLCHGHCNRGIKDPALSLGCCGTYTIGCQLLYTSRAQ